MKIKTLQWNIGGGKIRKINSDPKQDIGSLISSYSEDGLDYIISKIKEWNPDIVTLQETHANKNIVQVKIIAKQLGFSYFVNDKYSDSHIEKGQYLCQSIISKYPIFKNSFVFFKNPHFKTQAKDGSMWLSIDKGYTSVDITLPNNEILHVSTLHLLPFPRFKREHNDPEVIEVLRDVSNKILIKMKSPTLIQGDFNIDDKSLKMYLPELLTAVDEIETIEPTTPNSRRYDHVLYKDLRFIKYKIYDDVLTDHYPIISEFDI